MEILRRLAAVDVGSAIPCDNIPGCSDGVTADNILDNGLMWVFIGLGILAVLMLMYGGIQFMLSQGDSSKAQKARNTIIYSLIGVVVVIVAGAITGFVLGIFG